MIKVTVIVTVYNIEKYISRCLESLCAQQLDGLEIIIIDDGSTDSSGTICDSYAEIDSRIRVIHKHNEGLVCARKTGLQVAKGEYVCYVDGDDWIECGALKKMYLQIVSDNSDIVKYGHFENIEDFQKYVFHNVRPGVYSKKRLLNEVYPHMISGEEFYQWQIFPSVWDMIIKKELLEKSQFDVDEDIVIGEDAACVYPCLLLAERVSFVDEAYYHYRQSINSMIKRVEASEVVRHKYYVLQRYVYSKLKELSYIYDVTEQWMEHLIFSMIPRSFVLYDGIENLGYVFPFKNIKKGSKVALYCAGTYGQLLCRYLVESSICEVVVWVDKNYQEYRKHGLRVDSPEELVKYEFDGIIVASMFSNDQKNIISYIHSLGIVAELGVIDARFICSDEVKRGFRLI